jgi:gamma-glutamyltranspeptidase
MTPTVIQYDHDLMVIGGAGGSLIPTSVIQIFLSIDRLGMDPQAAVEAPRYHHQLYPNTLFVEHPFSFTLQKELEAKGHEILRFSEGETYCQVNVIYKKNGILHTGADPRREAGASGR